MNLQEYLKNPHDHFFKELLTPVENAAAFMQNFLPPDVLATLDVTHPALDNDSFVDEALRDQHSDLLFLVQKTNRDAAFIYVLFEHKSAPDKWVAWQVLRYVMRVWERALRNGATSLPPIFPLVVYHGAARWQVPHEFSALLDLQQAEALRAFQPEFHYHLCDLSGIDLTQIKGAAYLQAGLRLLQTIFTDEFETALAEAIDIMLRVPEPSTMELLQKLLRYSAGSRRNLARDKVRQMINAKFKEKERETLMNTLAEQWMQEGQEIGLQKGLLQGRQEGRQEGWQAALLATTLRVLQWKFALPEAQTQRIHTLTLPQLEDLNQTAFTLADHQELQQWLDAQPPAGTTESQANN